MDRYTDDRNAEIEFFRNEIVFHKEKALTKVKCISEDYDIQEKFAQMLIDAECEGCVYAEDFMSYFEIDDLDKYAILDDLELFIDEWKQQKENEVDYE